MIKHQRLIFGLFLVSAILFGAISVATWPQAAQVSQQARQAEVVVPTDVVIPTAAVVLPVVPSEQEQIVRAFVQALNEHNCRAQTGLTKNSSVYTDAERLEICMSDTVSNFSPMEIQEVVLDGDSVMAKIWYVYWGVSHIIRYTIGGGLITSIRTVE